MDLVEAVVNLHNIARVVEQQLGHGQLSDDIRSCADRLHDLLKPAVSTQASYDPVI